MRTQPKTTPADALLSVGISPNVADANGEPANLVDAISQVANAIRYGAKWLGNGEAASAYGGAGAHGKAIIDAGDNIAGSYPGACRRHQGGPAMSMTTKQLEAAAVAAHTEGTDWTSILGPIPP